jgi:TolB-like protein/DNA-binding winged helix-turn-helix (wHTH) protein/tetratricopeptide (TPR) repeat protein
MPSAPKETLSFGGFHLIVSDRVLTMDGKPVALPPRATEMLAVLAARANELVSKDDLMRAVWPDTFVEEGNLAVHIFALRKLLAGAGSPVEIETIPKRGYRLVGEVHSSSAEPVMPSSAVEPNVTPDRQPVGEASSHGLGPLYALPGRTLGGIALAIGLLVLAGVGLDRWANRAQGGVEAGGARIQSLAVLPLQNLSGDPAQDYFAAGVTDELTTELAHIHGLRVVSRTSASQFQAAHSSLPEIARALGVEGVMEGSVLRAGNRVRITTQLIEAKNDRHIWAGSYEGSVDEVIMLQDRVALDVAREVRAAVRPEGGLPPAGAQASAAGVNTQAYDDYLQGLYMWNRRDIRTFDKAIEFFSRANAEDPHFAPAFASLADVYVLYALNDTASANYGPRARQAALQALALDGNSAEAHTALGAVSAVFEWDWATAGREFQRATDLDPNYATAHQWFADFYLIPELRFEDAARELDAAVALDPLSPIMFVDRGWVDYLRGNYAQARQKYDRALAMDPDFIPAHFRIREWYLAQGRDAEYVQVLTTVIQLSEGGNESHTRAIREGFARDGIRGISRAELELGRASGRPHWEWSAFTAQNYAVVGDSPRACAALRGALRQREPAMLYLNVDPVYRPIRVCPCYAEVAQQIGLPQLPSVSLSSSKPLASSSPAAHPQASK